MSLPRIVVDAMGGDFAPGVTVAGAIEAASALDVEVLLVGPTDVLERELHAHHASVSPSNGRLRLVHAQDVIAMDETSAVAAQREMATAAAGDGMAADLRRKLAALHDGFGPGPVGYRVAPLAKILVPLKGLASDRFLDRRLKRALKLPDSI